MHKNEELIHRHNPEAGSVVGRHKYALLRTRLTQTHDAHALQMMLSADDRILKLVAMPFPHRLRGMNAREYERNVADLICEDTFAVLPPSKKELEIMQAVLQEYGKIFALKNPIIHSSDGRILKEGNDAAIAAFQSALAKKEGVFVFGIGPDSGPVALAMESIRKIRDGITVPVQTGVDKNSGEPIIVQVKKRAFVTFNPLVAKNITEL